MILLPQQFQALVYHFFSGWVFALTWSGMNRLTWHYRNTVFRWILESLFFFSFVSLMYAGLIPITGGQTQLYLIVTFIIGTGIYLKFYAMTFNPLFESWVRFFSRWLFSIQKAWKKKKQARMKKRQLQKQKKQAQNEKKQAEKAKKKELKTKKQQQKQSGNVHRKSKPKRGGD